MFLIVLLSILLASTLHFCLTHFRRSGRLINKLPGPRAVPIFGNVLSIMIPTKDVWPLLKKWGAEYGPIYRLWMANTALIIIHHPDDVEKLLGNPKFTRKSQHYKLLYSWFKTGLLTSSGKKWQTRRKILTPAFHFNVLDQFMGIFIEEGNCLVEMLKSEGGPVVKDLLPIISEHTLNMICESAMGTSLRNQGMFQYEYRSAVRDMVEILIYRLTRPWFVSEFTFSLCPQGWRQSALLKILHGFTERIIQERRKYHEDTNDRYLKKLNDTSDKANDNPDSEYRKKRLAMLDLLLAAHQNNQIDDEGIREEVDTFMFRGHDTTAMALCFTIMLLAEHKEIQDRARAEVKTVMDECEGKLTMSALQNLSYLERCIKESLRLYPSVSLISRETETDIVLSNYVVPAGTTITVHISDVHRDPVCWPNPDVFDPDRFLPENSYGRHPYSYVPFSVGPRNCIGQRFAILELKVTLSYLLHNFLLEPVDYLKDLVASVSMVIHPLHPIRSKFVPL